MKKILVMVTLVLIIGLAGCTSGGTDSDTTTDTADKTTEAEKKDDAEKMGKVGEPLKIGDVEYTIKSTKETSTVGSEYFNQKAKGVYILVDVKIKNNGNEALDIASSYFKLKLGDKEFETDTSAEMYLEDKAMVFDSLNPDSTMKGTIVFDVTKKIAKDPDLVLQLQTGAWGTETGMIKL